MDNKYWKFFLKFSLGSYLVILGWVLFFQIGTTDRDSYFVNPDDHFLPFSSTYNMLKNAFTYRFTPQGGQFQKIFLINVLGNLVLLLPWGFLAPLVFKKLNNFLKIALSGFCISFAAEVTQYIFSLGIFDIDDLMFNTVGAVVGFYVLVVVKYLIWQVNARPVDNLSQDKLKRNNA